MLPGPSWALCPPSPSISIPVCVTSALTISPRERSPELPNGLFNWIGTFIKVPDTYVLNHQCFDGYLLLRYLKMSAIICLVGCLLVWPILFPINATGGGGQQQLNAISFSNIDSTTQVNRFYAHVIVACIFFSQCESYAGGRRLNEHGY